MDYPQFDQKARADFDSPKRGRFSCEGWQPKAAMFAWLLSIASLLWIDQPLTQAIAAWIPNHPELRKIFAGITKLGDSKVFLAPSLLLIFGLWLAEHTMRTPWLSPVRLRQLLHGSLLLFAAVLLSGILANLLKFVIGRPRPALWLQQGMADFQPFTTGHAWHSYPSGHSTTAGAVAVLIAQMGQAVTGKPQGKLWGYAAVLYALLIASSRLILLKHYLADTIAGLTLGALCSWALLRCYRHYCTNANTPKEKPHPENPES
jgi:membrane-associated phospholipid phosphatase